jgi:hypothetical protein
LREIVTQLMKMGDEELEQVLSFINNSREAPEDNSQEL